jgi:hypothetical protein
MGWLMDRVNPYWLISAFFVVDAWRSRARLHCRRATSGCSSAR